LLLYFLLGCFPLDFLDFEVADLLLLFPFFIVNFNIDDVVLSFGSLAFVYFMLIFRLGDHRLSLSYLDQLGFSIIQ
jgi:hypothetical protein